MLQRVILCLDLGAVIGLVLWLLLSYRKRRDETQKNYYLKLQKALMEEHSKMLKGQIEMARLLRHDLANHIQTMESLELSNRTEDYYKYEKQLKELYQALKADGLCQNYVLDAMLVRKRKQCKEKNITFDTSLLTMDGAGIEQSDLMVVFYELMEYGMVRAEQSKRRTFALEGNQEKGYLFLRLSCPASEKVTERNLKKTVNEQLSQTAAIAGKYDGEVHGAVQEDMIQIFFTARLGKGEKEDAA